LSTGIRSTIFLAFLISVLATFSGCGGGGGSSTSDSGAQVGSAPLPTKVLSWEPPTSYADSSTMNPVTDLDRFEIYVKETNTFTDTDVPMAELRAVDAQTHTLATSFNLANLGSHLTVGPHYYVSLRAVALTGLKSDFSPGVSFSF
jgi:hypothetical protein